MAEWNFRLRAKLDDEGQVTKMTTESLDDEMAKWGDSWQDQERDDRGRFGSGGGGGNTPPGATSHDGGAHISYSGNPRPGMGDIPRTPDMVAKLQNSTAGAHMDAQGNFTPERQALHDQIVSNAVSGVPASDNPRLVMMGGGPGSGKSSMVDSGVVSLPSDAVHNDPDKIKDQIPEVAQMQGAGDKQWAAASHEESSYISARITAASYEGNKSMTLDTTGDSDAQKLGDKIDAAHAAGYKVEGNYVTISPDAGVERAMARAEATGREVPESVIRNTYAGISTVLPQAIGKYDTMNLYDNNGPMGSVPQLIAASVSGHLTVHDPAAYSQFLGYAH